MVRIKHLDAPVPTRFNIPESVIARVKLELYSDLEGRVPYGVMSALVTKLLNDWLKERLGEA